jgi:hypothetical protein
MSYNITLIRLRPSKDQTNVTEFNALLNVGLNEFAAADPKSVSRHPVYFKDMN